ncbi:MAG: M15 family metallopeptidase [Clostridiaceae bacterium]|nr:M15 family metallopeptidase [Clostridiaceae bacterium]
MKKIVYMIFILFIFSGCDNTVKDKSIEGANFPSSTSIENSYDHDEKTPLNQEKTKIEDIELDEYDINMKRDLLCLKMAYPEYVSYFERDAKGEVYLVMTSGNKILYDDRLSKTYNQKLANADLQDTMEMLYPLGNISELMEDNYDPGRFRCYAFLKEVYGGSRQQIENYLEGVSIGGKVCSFNNRNNASAALKQVAAQMKILGQSNNIVRQNIFPVNGTYNYRVIAGTNQLSPHAFAIAIDFKSDKRDYWKWASRELGQQRLGEYPREAVEILEENNFIWGGKWAHFDILHFEYRPELIIKARYYVEDFEMEGSWYYGFPTEDERVKSYIETIDRI